MSHPAEQDQAGATHAGSSLTQAEFENLLQNAWASHPRLCHWNYNLVKARLAKALNDFMDKTYGCGPFYDPADFPLVRPAQGYGELGEGTGSRTVWQAIYSFKNGDKPRHIPSAAVAGRRFMQSQLKGPSESNKRRLREYGYITEAENRATCVSNHVVCTGYSSEEWGKSG
ncbi:hypothetical protein RHOSPDRAFT_26875 [Rhodotorula sp. JG-1b]|nr:hypothetical protein RHOSPDRAFT_26875 [Rhodotorula sp. JG-1b]